MTMSSLYPDHAQNASVEPTSTRQTKTTRVGIIGAGASGLAQLKQLLEAFSRPEVKARTELEVIVIEKQSEVGGVWYADEEEEKRYETTTSKSTIPNGRSEDGDQLYIYPPENEDPSPMYQGLRTNLPHELMAFRSLPMPESLPIFPTRAQIQEYLISYAKTFDLYPYIKFNTSVTRLRYSPPDSARRWSIEYKGDEGCNVIQVDCVCCANGHYADGWIPPTPGLSEFQGRVLHSRYFRSAEDYAGQKVLVVGSFASGGDISRLLAAYNLGMWTKDGSIDGTPIPGFDSAGPIGGIIDVHVSCSAPSAFSVDPNDTSTPWGKYVTYHPLIDHIAPLDITDSIIHFDNGTTLQGVNTIIYASGYNFALPFAKSADLPWCNTPLFDKKIKEGERKNGEKWEEGGLKGSGVNGLDPLMLFLENDSSICFPVLQYQVVPFPLAESQTRLSSYLWAGLLPSFPDHPIPPYNPSNPYSKHPDIPDKDETKTNVKPPRKVMQTRQQLVFGAPYEWTYQEYLMDLMKEAEVDGVEGGCWKAVEGFRRDQRADTGLRKRTLGY